MPHPSEVEQVIIPDKERNNLLSDLIAIEGLLKLATSAIMNNAAGAAFGSVQQAGGAINGVAALLNQLATTGQPQIVVPQSKLLIPAGPKNGG